MAAAKLDGIHLHNANLTAASVLTAEQLKTAQIDSMTKLPRGLATAVKMAEALACF